MSNEYLSWCLELLAPAGTVRARRMFGGHGLYVDDLFIALIAGEQLYLKVDADTRDAFVAAGCVPFEYTTPQGARGVMSYFSTPAEAMESPALMQPWVRLAMASALRASASKPSPKPRAKADSGSSSQRSGARGRRRPAAC
jgi:DNA transformation protein